MPILRLHLFVTIILLTLYDQNRQARSWYRGFEEVRVKKIASIIVIP